MSGMARSTGKFRGTSACSVQGPSGSRSVAWGVVLPADLDATRTTVAEVRGRIAEDRVCVGSSITYIVAQRAFSLRAPIVPDTRHAGTCVPPRMRSAHRAPVNARPRPFPVGLKRQLSENKVHMDLFARLGF